MKQAAVFVVFLACCVFISVHSRSVYQLNEEKKQVPDMFHFQSQDELESQDLERRRSNEQLRNWDDHRDSNGQSCAGLHGSWFC
jgi:hypothetical protein